MTKGFYLWETYRHIGRKGVHRHVAFWFNEEIGVGVNDDIIPTGYLEAEVNFG